MKILKFPISKQTFDYDCGAKAMQSILTYYGIDLLEIEIIKIAKSNSDGTPIHGMIKVAKHFGFNAKAEKITIDKLKKYINRKIPVILLIQAWAKRKIKNWKNDWKDGHYVVAIGYDKKRIYFEDPYAVLRTYLTYSELEERWHDIDSSTGKKYEHSGIILLSDKKGSYNPDKIIHMG